MNEVSSTQQPDSIPESEVKHPWWCSLTTACEGDLKPLDSVRHIGKATTWETAADTRLSLRLVRYDDHDRLKGRESDDTTVELTIESLASAMPDGSPMVVDTRFTAAEVDTIIQFLQHFRRNLKPADLRYEPARRERSRS